MVRAAVDETVLGEIVRRLVESVQPQKIILFGSRARGQAGAHSDVDLIIVKPSTAPPHRRLAPAYQALWGIPVPIDLLWYTPEELADWAGVPSHLAARALREGRLLYGQDEP